MSHAMIFSGLILIVATYGLSAQMLIGISLVCFGVAFMD